MSGNTLSPGLTEAGCGLNPLLRYAVGSAVIMVVAMAWDYTLAYLTPVLALNFLAPGSKPPTLKSSITFLLSMAVANMTGVVFGNFFLAYPLVFLPLLLLVLFHIYYTTAFPSVKLWLIISLVVIPMMAMQSPALGSMVAINLFMNALMALLLVWMAWFVFPGREPGPDGHKTAGPPLPGAAVRFRSALQKILVVAPVLVLFFVFNLYGSLLVLVFISVLSMNPAMANKKIALAMVLANLGGGVAAIIAFNLVTAATSIVFFGMLILLAGLVFAPRVFSHKPTAALFGMAYSTFLLIFGSVVSLAGEASEKVWERVALIGVAMVYMVVAFGITGRLISTNDKPKQAL